MIKIPLQVRTSQMKYRGFDKLDITVKSGNYMYAPTWDMVMGHKSGKVSNDEYHKKYIAMMKQSYEKNNVDWKELLSRETVTLVCYCAKGKFCHRLIMAKILVMMGAEYKGEI